MAGSLHHIVDDDGAFTMETIENMGDAYEALEQCFDLIALLSANKPRAELRRILDAAKAPWPKAFPRFGARADDAKEQP